MRGEWITHHATGRFRALLRQIREDARLSQTELAAKLNKPQTFVSNPNSASGGWIFWRRWILRGCGGKP